MQPATPAQRHWRRNVQALAAGNFFTNLGWSGAFAFMPLVVREMQVGENLELWVGAIAAGYFCTSCFFTPVWGVFADYYGRKSMVLRAGLGMGTGFLLVSLIDQPLWFLLTMVVVGLANGYVPAGQALIATNTPREHTGGALSFTQAAAWVGNMLGPLLAATLASWLPRYHYLMTVAGSTCLIAGLLAMLLVREEHVRPAHALRLDMRADFKRLWRVPQLKALYFCNLTFAFNVFGANAVVSLLVVRMLEATPRYAGYGVETWVAAAVMGFTVASVTALPLWGRLLNHHDPPRLLRWQLAGSFAFGLLLPLVRNPLELTLARILFGLFISGLAPTLIRMIRDRAPQGMEGRTLSYGTALQQTGSGAAPLLAGLLAPHFGLRSFFMVSCAMLGVALLLWWRGRAAVRR